MIKKRNVVFYVVRNYLFMRDKHSSLVSRWLFRNTGVLKGKMSSVESSGGGETIVVYTNSRRNL